jgi:hypothetical protein
MSTTKQDTPKKNPQQEIVLEFRLKLLHGSRLEEIDGRILRVHRMNDVPAVSATGRDADQKNHPKVRGREKEKKNNEKSHADKRFHHRQKWLHLVILIPCRAASRLLPVAIFVALVNFFLVFGG